MRMSSIRRESDMASVEITRPDLDSILRAVRRKGTVPIRNEMAADVYLEPPPPAVVEAELGLGSTRWEPAMELLEPGTTV
jgi:hypothetical protein